MKLSQEIKLLLLIMGAFLTGLIVILVNPDYRLEINRESNVQYYAESLEDPDTPDETVDLETSRDLQKDIEF